MVTTMVTLTEMRRQSGLSLQMVLLAVRRIAPDVAPTARSGIIHWERQGTDNIRVIRALAEIYARPLHDVETAMIAAQNENRRRRAESKLVTIH